MNHIERVCNILTESKMVRYLLRNMENIASSVGKIAQYRLSLCRKVAQWEHLREQIITATKPKEEEKKFILEFIEVYHSLPALWNVESKGLRQQNEQNEQHEHLLRKYIERFPDADKNLILCVLTPEKKWSD
jgi:hypothetical protein